MDCFDKSINVLDQNSSEFSIFDKRYQSMVLNMLKTCFPYGEIKREEYFNTPNQRIICLYMTNAMNKIEIVAVCFIRQISNDLCFIHSVCVKKNKQGHKCCDRLFSYLLSNYGHQYNLVLNVRVDKYKGHGLPANHAAIKCYSKYGFVFTNELCFIHDDGLNCRMIRIKAPYIQRRNLIILQDKLKDLKQVKTQEQKSELIDIVNKLLIDDKDEIKKTRRKLQLKYHPDKGLNKPYMFRIVNDLVKSDSKLPFSNLQLKQYLQRK